MQYDDAKRDKYSYLNAFKYLFSNHEGIDFEMNLEENQLRWL